MNRFSNSITKLAPTKVWGPVLILSCIISCFPLFNSIRYFLSSMIFGGMLLSSQNLSMPFINSVLSIILRAAIVSAIASIFIAPVAFYIRNSGNIRIRSIIIGVLLLQFVINDSLRSFAWGRILAADGAIAQTFAYITSGDPASYSLRFSTLGLYLVMFVNILPFGILATLPFVPHKSDLKWRTAIELDGNQLIAFIRTVVPSALPGVILGCLWMFLIATFGSAEEHYVGNSTSMAKIISDVLNIDNPETWAAFFILSVFIVLILLTVMILAYIAYTKKHTIAKLAVSAIHRVIFFKKNNKLVNNEKWSFLNYIFIKLHWPSIFLLLILVLAPVFYILFKGIFGNNYEDYHLTSKFILIFQSGRTRDALISSLIIASIVGIVATIASTIIAASWFKNKKATIFGIVSLAIGAIYPHSAYALGITRMGLGLKGGYLLLIISHISWVFPFCVTIILCRMALLQDTILVTSIELDKKVRIVWRRTILPQLLYSLLGAMLFSFLLSLNESERTAFLRGRVETLSSRIMGALGSGFVAENDHIYLLTAILVIFTIISGFIALQLSLFPNKSHKK